MPAPKITEALIRSYIEEGRGVGHGEDYKAFIQLKRWNASPVSTQVCSCLYPFRRRCHFLSRSEWLLALVFAWVGSWVREQFPMWPWAHPHPLLGLPDAADARLPVSSGTLDICRRAGVRHGFFVGTRAPYIWTLDLVASHPWMPIGTEACSIVSVKPLDSEPYSGEVDPLFRGVEKLDIESLYAREIQARYFVADRSAYPGPLLGQLELYHGSAWQPEDGTAHAIDGLLQRYGSELPRNPPQEWQAMLRADFGLCEAAADYAVHHILWHQLIDVDLSRLVRYDHVPEAGGRLLMRRLRRSMVGATL